MVYNTNTLQATDLLTVWEFDICGYSVIKCNINKVYSVDPSKDDDDCLMVDTDSLKNQR